MQALGRWLWYSPGLPARAARATLLAPSAAVAVAGRARAAAYAARVFGVRALPRPTVSVGNLAVGGTGKTPIASWIAAQIAARGLVPGILLRGGRWGDEALVHRRLVPPAVVIEHPDRHAGAALAVTRGADVLVLDDGYQRLDVGRDLNILLLSAEGASASQVLPAGPWREGWAALSRADLVGITHKRSSPERAQALQDRVARLAPSAATVTVHLDVWHWTRCTGERPST